jgi:drug/metabolite transporter (DMT)-like permease
MSPRLQAALALVTVYLAWGGTYPAIRVMVETAPPLIATGVRFLIAGVLLYAWLRIRGGSQRVNVPRRELIGAALVGTVILGDIGLLALAEQEVPAGLAALIIASVPLWIVLLRLVHGERPARGTLVAVAAGLAGVALLVAPAGSGGPPIGWLLLLVAAAAIEAAGQFWSPRAPLPADALVSTALQLLAAGLFLIVAGALAGELDELRPERFSGESLLAFAYLVGPGSLLAYAAFVWLLANVPISTVSTYAYVNPVVAVLLGWALLGEEISPAMAAGALAVLASVALIVRDRPRAARSDSPRSRS